MMRQLASALCLACFILAMHARHPNLPSAKEVDEIRAKVDEFYRSGMYVSLVDLLLGVERKYGTLHLEPDKPSLYGIMGVVVSGTSFHDNPRAITYLEMAVAAYPKDTRALINLGEVKSYGFDFEGATAAYKMAVAAGDLFAMPRLLKLKGWSDDWHDLELLGKETNALAHACLRPREPCMVDSAIGMEYAGVHGALARVFYQNSPNVAPSDTYVPGAAPLAWQKSIIDAAPGRGGALRVGLLSSDYNVHPVPTLLRGVIQMLHGSPGIELYCFALLEELSWWGVNISATIGDRFVFLNDMNTLDAAREIASRGVHILVELNLHTLNNGFGVLAHRPAPVQASFLGLPTTSGASFIHYYLGDWVSIPAEHRIHYSEKLALLPPCYIANDYAQMRGDVFNYVGSERATRSDVPSSYAGDNDFDVSIFFSSFSNSQKVDAPIFAVWTNILRMFPSSQIMLIEHMGHKQATPRLKAYASMYGLRPRQIASTAHKPWIYHINSKTAFDFHLDTPLKNGHTSGLDVLWSGLPTMSLGGGSESSARAAESIAQPFTGELGLAYSYKGYEDAIYRIKGVNGRAGDVARESNNFLATWRRWVEHCRKTSVLFDTAEYSEGMRHLLQATWEASQISTYRASKLSASESGGDMFYHVFAAGRPEGSELKHSFPVMSMPADSSNAHLHPRGSRGKHAESPKEYIHVAKPEVASASTSDSSGSSSGGGGSVESASKQRMSGEQQSCTFGDSSCVGTRALQFTALPPQMFNDNEIIMLNIGGLCHQDGWLAVNVANFTCPWAGSTHSERGLGQVDIIREMGDLFGFPANSVSAIYNSHVLEHTTFATVEAVLREWYRVIRPGGLLFVSVPDLAVLSGLLLNDTLNINEKLFVTKMVYGAQSDAYDFHHVGFNEQILLALLHNAQFCDIQRVRSLNVFRADTSDMLYLGVPISLNVVARVCEGKAGAGEYDGFELSHNAII